MQESVEELEAPPATGGTIVALATCALVCTVSWCLGVIWGGGGIHARYILLKRPAWAIPLHWLPHCWSALHIAMTLALWRVWQLRQRDNHRALLWFLLSFLFLLLWPYIYFQQQRPVASLAFAALMWATQLGWLAAARRVSRTACILVFACGLWSLYVLLLTFALTRLNNLELTA